MRRESISLQRRGVALRQQLIDDCTYYKLHVGERRRGTRPVCRATEHRSQAALDLLFRGKLRLLYIIKYV